VKREDLQKNRIYRSPHGPVMLVEIPNSGSEVMAKNIDTAKKPTGAARVVRINQLFLADDTYIDRTLVSLQRQEVNRRWQEMKDKLEKEIQEWSGIPEIRLNSSPPYGYQKPVTRRAVLSRGFIKIPAIRYYAHKSR
jgi:hypothetical protein